MFKNDEFNSQHAQRLLTAWKMLKAGKIEIAPQFQKQAAEIMAAPLLMSGLVDVSSLSSEAILFGRMTGIVGSSLHETLREEQTLPSLPVREAQQELFNHFAQLFSALTGRDVRLIAGEREIHERMLFRAKHEMSDMASRVNAAAEQLETFYASNARLSFSYAKSLGGMRLVMGGQRTFGPSALNAVRITGLYADTQLIPDPVHSFFTSELNLNAQHLQLANTLFHILQLRPLVDADLPIMPVFVFQSFDQSLQEHDAHTMHGIEQLVLRLLQPLCDTNIASLDELFGYAQRCEDKFLQAIFANQLFVPPGASPNHALQPSEAAHTYISELEGLRSEKYLDQLKRMPTGVLILNGVMERLAPQYHLIENASELGAQPLLSQKVHWHYFEKCATANATELRRRDILSDQAFQTLRAVQDDSLSWLANIPVEGLCELIVNNEHRWLREELNKHTTQLASAGEINTNEMVREVSFGLTSIIQRQQKAMNDIEKKYAPKKWATLLGGGAGLAVAGAAMLPILSPFLGVSIPAAAAAAAIGGATLGFGKEKIGEHVEKRQFQTSMIGMLATAHSK